MARKKNDDQRHGGRSDDAEQTLDRVGYGRPPEATQFKPGQSGNPKGRPKRAPSMDDIVSEALAKTIEIRQGEHTKRIPMLKALIQTAAHRALKGNHKYFRTILQLWAERKTKPEINDVASEAACQAIAGYLDQIVAEKQEMGIRLKEAQALAKSLETRKPRPDIPTPPHTSRKV